MRGWVLMADTVSSIYQDMGSGLQNRVWRMLSGGFGQWHGNYVATVVNLVLAGS